MSIKKGRDSGKMIFFFAIPQAATMRALQMTLHKTRLTWSLIVTGWSPVLTPLSTFTERENDFGSNDGKKLFLEAIAQTTARHYFSFILLSFLHCACGK